jgi:hypothetical protein
MGLHVGGGRRRRNSGSEESTVDDGVSSNDDDHREAKAEVRENHLRDVYACFSASLKFRISTQVFSFLHS